MRLRDKLIPSLAARPSATVTPSFRASPGHGVSLRHWDDLTPAQQHEAGEYFDSNLSPALTPLVIDVVHPFPFISNLSTSLIFLLRDPVRNEQMYARVKDSRRPETVGTARRGSRRGPKAFRSALRNHARQRPQTIRRHDADRRHARASHPRRRSRTRRGCRRRTPRGS